MTNNQVTSASVLCISSLLDKMSANPDCGIPPIIPKGTLQPVEVDGVVKIVKYQDGVWVFIGTNQQLTASALPEGAKVVVLSIGYSDRYGYGN